MCGDTRAYRMSAAVVASRSSRSAPLSCRAWVSARCTWWVALILDLVDPARTAMVNDPTGLRVCGEHLFPLRFPDLVPPTTVTAHPRTITSFVDDHRIAVVKPVDGFAGRGVLLLDRDDPNLPSLIEISTHNGTRAVVVQPFLPEVTDGDKRIFVVDGEPVGAVLRFPVAGDFRIGNPVRKRR